MKTKVVSPQKEIEDLLDRLYSQVEENKRYAFTEALAIAKELCQHYSDGGYIAEKVRHISQSAGIRFIDRETGKINKWEGDF